MGGMAITVASGVPGCTAAVAEALTQAIATPKRILAKRGVITLVD
jgi:hypothetical protein